MSDLEKIQGLETYVHSSFVVKLPHKCETFDKLETNLSCSNLFSP